MATLLNRLVQEIAHYIDHKTVAYPVSGGEWPKVQASWVHLVYLKHGK